LLGAASIVIFGSLSSDSSVILFERGCNREKNE